MYIGRFHLDNLRSGLGILNCGSGTTRTTLLDKVKRVFLLSPPSRVKSPPEINFAIPNYYLPHGSPGIVACLVQKRFHLAEALQIQHFFFPCFDITTRQGYPDQCSKFDKLLLQSPTPVLLHMEFQAQAFILQELSRPLDPVWWSFTGAWQYQHQEVAIFATINYHFPISSRLTQLSLHARAHIPMLLRQPSMIVCESNMKALYCGQGSVVIDIIFLSFGWHHHEIPTTPHSRRLRYFCGFGAGMKGPERVFLPAANPDFHTMGEFLESGNMEFAPTEQSIPQ